MFIKSDFKTTVPHPTFQNKKLPTSQIEQQLSKFQVFTEDAKSCNATVFI